MSCPSSTLVRVGSGTSLGLGKSSELGAEAGHPVGLSRQIRDILSRVKINDKKSKVRLPSKLKV